MKRLIPIVVTLVFATSSLACSKEAASTDTPAAATAETAPSPSAAKEPAAAPKKTPPPAAKAGVTQAECEAACAHAQTVAMGALPADTSPEVRGEMESGFAKRCVPNCLTEATPASNACVLKAKTVQDLGTCQAMVE